MAYCARARRRLTVTDSVKHIMGLLEKAKKRRDIAAQEMNDLRDSGYGDDDQRMKTARAFYSDAVADANFIGVCLAGVPRETPC